MWKDRCLTREWEEPFTSIPYSTIASAIVGLGVNALKYANFKRDPRAYCIPFALPRGISRQDRSRFLNRPRHSSWCVSDRSLNLLTILRNRGERDPQLHCKTFTCKRSFSLELYDGYSSHVFTTSLISILFDLTDTRVRWSLLSDKLLTDVVWKDYSKTHVIDTKLINCVFKIIINHVMRLY